MSGRSIFALAALTVLGASCLMAADASAYNLKTTSQRNVSGFRAKPGHFGPSNTVCTHWTIGRAAGGGIYQKPVSTCQQRSMGVYR
jgi:hypothetical protein